MGGLHHTLYLGGKLLKEAKREPIILWGATGQAKVLYEFSNKTYQIIALMDQDTTVLSPFSTIALYHDWSALKKEVLAAMTEPIYFAIAIGGIYRGKDRLHLQEMLISEGLQPVNLIHPTAYQATTARLGQGNQILAKAVVCAEVQTGDQCIINTGATLDHESRIGHGVHICPGAHVLGDVTIKDYATIGAGAVILPHLQIGQSAVVGAGSVILHDVPDNAIVVGNPGRIIRYTNAQ